jgi:pimeloyl-ACP methyl ester carboxylesterase
MQEKYIQTNVGNIAVYDTVLPSDLTPVILLHGVYLDHHLWDEYVGIFENRRVIAIDMPLHGRSKQITSNWNLDDCAIMLKDILDELKIPKVIAIGHSWGAMTILRTANKYPSLFSSIGFCNLPFEQPSLGNTIIFHLRNMGVVAKQFYINQACQSLFAKSSIQAKPAIVNKLSKPMNQLTRSQIIATNNRVIIQAKDSTEMIGTIKIPCLALKGEDDYVPTSKHIPTELVKGGHLSPIESVLEVQQFCRKVVENEATQ